MTTAIEPRTFVHPLAVCESSDIGDGTRIWAFTIVQSGARIGRGCNLCSHVFVEEGSRIGDGVVVKNGVSIWKGVTIEDCAFIGPGVVFSNDRFPRSRYLPEAATRYASDEQWLSTTHVREGASIGGGAVILCGITIGAYALVGAGSVVTSSVPDHAIVVGNPARQVGTVCRCGRRTGGDESCTSCAAALLKAVPA